MSMRGRPRYLQNSGGLWSSGFSLAPVRLLCVLVWHASSRSAESATLLKIGLPGPKPNTHAWVQVLAHPVRYRLAVSIRLYFSIGDFSVFDIKCFIVQVSYRQFQHLPHFFFAALASYVLECLHQVQVKH